MHFTYVRKYSHCWSDLYPFGQWYPLGVCAGVGGRLGSAGVGVGVR